MPANYTIIQYVPDAVMGERVNVGVAAYFEGQVQARFLMNWDRVRTLGGKSALTLDRIEAVFRGIEEPRLRAMIETWTNSIQFTEPGASIYPIERALDIAVRRYLIDPAPAAAFARRREDVILFARDSLRASVNHAMGRTMGKSLVRSHVVIQGKSGQSREYDLGVRRDKPIRVFQALSFAGAKGTERSVQSAAFLAEEVKGHLPMTIVYAPPAGESPEFEKARRTFDYLEVEFVSENDFGVVTAKVVAELAAAA